MYLERGRADGFDGEDWRRAERELKAPAHYSYTSAAGDVRGTTGMDSRTSSNLHVFMT
jgi:hypothetical protein